MIIDTIKSDAQIPTITILPIKIASEVPTLCPIKETKIIAKLTKSIKELITTSD